MLTSVKLVDGSRQMNLMPRQDQGVFVQGLDAPSPSTREAVEDRTDDDGTRDTTLLFGARACSLELLVTQDARAVEEELTRYLHPRSRPYLVVEDTGWAQARRLMLRVDQWTAPLTTDLPRDARKIQLQWKAPDGIWEASETAEETVVGDLASTDGRTYPRTYPWSYPVTLSTGASLIANPGAVPAHFTAKLYGPCSGPQLINETTGERIAFTTELTLAAGDYVEIDTRNKAAYLLGDTAATRLNMIDFTRTSWWQLEPGEQQVRYAPLAGSTGTAAVITYRPAWL